MSDPNTANDGTGNPSRLQRMAVFVTTGAGVGFSPWMPGTFGTLWGLPMAWGVGLLPSLWAQGVAIFALFFIGLPLCSTTTRVLGRGKDPGAIVWDEIIAMPVVFFGTQIDLYTAVVGFVLFRLFDITKPWPACSAEKLPEGWGVMTDDIVAGVYANLALNAVIWYLPLASALG